jgi:hypothetical protein
MRAFRTTDQRPPVDVGTLYCMPIFVVCRRRGTRREKLQFADCIDHCGILESIELKCIAQWPDGQ